MTKLHLHIRSYILSKRQHFSFPLADIRKIGREIEYFSSVDVKWKMPTSKCQKCLMSKAELLFEWDFLKPPDLIHKMKYFAFSISTYVDSMHRKVKTKRIFKREKKERKTWLNRSDSAAAGAARRKTRREDDNVRRMLRTPRSVAVLICALICFCVCVCERVSVWLYVLSRHRFNVLKLDSWIMIPKMFRRVT